MQTLKTALLVVFMLIAIYGAYMIISKPPAKPPAEVTQLTEKDLKAPDIGIGKTVSPDELVFGSAADISNQSEDGTETGNDFGPGDLDASLNINIDGLDNPASTPPGPDDSQPNASQTKSDTTLPVPPSTSAPTGNQQSDPDSLPFEVNNGAAFENPATNNNPSVSITDKSTDAVDPLNATQSQAPLINTPRQDLERPGNNPSQVNPASVTIADNSVNYASPAERSFKKAWNSAVKQSQQSHFRESLLTLSVFFDDPNLSQVNQSKLLHQLDQLAAHVIYSRQHLLEPAFIVRPGDTLDSIARQYRVPSSLLQNINGIRPKDTLLPGTELKVVRGPFRASVSLTRNEMTLFLGHLYAGRFPVSVGNNPAPRPGSYQIQLKQPGRPFFNEAEQPIPAGDTNNPYGNVWLDLGSNLSIHGSPRIATTANQGQRCIGLTDVDARDIYGILTEGSQVIIRR